MASPVVERPKPGQYELSVELRDKWLGNTFQIGEFQLLYQPIVELPDGRMSGVESLVRWTPADGPIERGVVVVEAAPEPEPAPQPARTPVLSRPANATPFPARIRPRAPVQS